MSTTKNQIAEVFERHVQRFGFAKTTLDDVAREMHISKKTIYVHFESKREIYAYVVTRLATAEKLRMRSGVESLPTSRAKAEMLLRFILGSARTHIAETTQSEWMQEYEIAADAFRQAHGELMRDVVTQGIGSGEFSSGDPDFVEKMVAAMVLEYLVLVNADPAYDRDEELIDRTLRFIG